MRQFIRKSLPIFGSRRRVASGIVAGMVLALLPAVTQVAGSSASPSAQAVTESQRAAATGQPVEVVEARDEYSTTYANPDGTYRLDEAVSPVRVRDEDGDWHDPDATLERRADGSVGPRFATVDMSFSGGGFDPMVVLREDGRSVAMNFPKQLPEPVLSGSDATYPDVFPGVDLKVSASTTGFRQVLIVKTRAAARNPDLRGLTFPVKADGLSVRQSSSGTFEAVDANEVPVFAGPAGMMWDSAPPAAPAANDVKPPSSVGAAAGKLPDGDRDIEGAHGPTARSRVVGLRTRVAPKSLTVTPDAAWLDDPKTTYPVYIDPPIGTTRSGYTVFRSDGWKDWNFPNDEGVGKCGSLTISGTTYVCGSGYVQRQAFKFSNTNLVGKYVLKAAFRIRDAWSFTCTPSVTNLYRLSSGITTTTSWPGPSTADLVGDETFSAGRGTACSPEQPDRDIEFADDTNDTTDNLTATARKLADGGFSSISLELRNASETDTGDWKRFNGSTATLQVTYVPKPGVPTTTGVRASSSTTTSCSTSSASPTTVTKLTPTLAATLQTVKAPASGEEPGDLAGQFQIFTATGTTAVWDSGVAASAWQPDNYVRTVAVPSGKLVEGTVYRMKVRTQSHYVLGSTSGNLFSAYSGYCYFRAVLTAPKASTITVGTGQGAVPTYPICDPDCTAAGGPGQGGSFTVTNPMTTVTSFKWELKSGGKIADQGTATAMTSGTLRVGNFWATPQLEGQHELTVTAVNGAGPGEPASVFIQVAPGAGAVGEWKAEDVNAPWVDTSGGGHDLIMQGAFTSGQGRKAANVPGDGALDIVGASSAAVTSGPVVNTAGSFTASAWVYLRNRGTTAQIVLSQATSSPLAGFQLFYSGANDRWKMGVTGMGQTAPVAVQSVGKAVPVTNVWTHLTGVYDGSSGTVELYVNGVSQGKVAAPAPGATTGPLMVGRDEMGAAPENFDGLIDEATVWNRALTKSEVERNTPTYDTNGASATALVGYWQPSNLDLPLVDQSDYFRNSLTLFGGATAVADEGLVLNGTNAGAATAGPLVDENGSFTVSAKVHDMTTKTGKGRVVTQRNGSGTSWSLYFDYATKQWKFERTGLNAAGAVVTAVASTPAATAVDPGETVVTGVYDATTGSVQVLIGIAPQCSAGCSQQFASGQGSGEVNLGMTRSTSTATPADLLAGSVDWVRVWAGAMTENNLAQVVFS